MNERWAPLRKIFDAAAVATLAVVAVSGVVLHSAQPSFSRAMGLPRSPLMPLFFGIQAGTWSLLHDRSSFLFILLLLPNLFWSRDVYRWILRRGPRTGSLSRAAVGLIAVLSGGIWLMTGFHSGLPALEAPSQAIPLIGPGSDARLGELSLHEMEGRLGVPADYLRVNLGLPPDVDTGLPVNELMKTYHFTIENVRDVLLMHRMGNKGLPKASPAPRRPF